MDANAEITRYSAHTRQNVRITQLATQRQRRDQLNGVTRARRCRSVDDGIRPIPMIRAREAWHCVNSWTSAQKTTPAALPLRTARA